MDVRVGLKKAERIGHKESWALKNWYFWTVVLEKTLKSPLDSPRVSDPTKVIQPVHPKGNQSWIFIWRTDAEAEAPILWPPDGKNWHTGKYWCWERLKAGGEGDDRRWGGWMASTTRWTWVWASSRSWWWTGKPGMLQSLGSQSQTQLSDWYELNCACQSWVRAAEGDGNPQAFSAFLDSKGGSGIQRAQPTKRHGCRLLKVKASPHRVLCVNWWNGWRGSGQGTAMGSSRITNSRTFVCVPEETTLCKWEMGNHRIGELVHTGSGTRLLRLPCAYRSLNDSCRCIDRCWCGCWDWRQRILIPGEGHAGSRRIYSPDQKLGRNVGL